MIDAEHAMAIELLRQARKFDNQTVRDSREIAIWRRKIDDMLARYPGDDPSERYDTPERVEHRKFVNRLFWPRRHKPKQWEK